MSHPKHYVSAGVVVVNDEGKILLIRGPCRGWEQPGGQVEEGESIQDAAIREVKEETGIDIHVTRFCGIYQNLSSGVCATCWLAKPIGGKLETSNESLEVEFFTVEEALKMVTWSNFKERIVNSLDEKEHPFFVVFS
ncbi:MULTISPECIES: NUDIX hydrolase [Bacillus cereus group]|uniref:ADP-ribose pyrophosphatase n=1 Tax=Bacillus cereus TaxID=1396 RepID=A0AA44Q9Y4_BACCE|nr:MULTISPECIES: NUDIX hydrolase [Bacillus cereus group]PFN05219.1 ADP-ribose pyrophosphatase [Bacillus cereus]PFO77820.1 ADP-ribose pyrophosphatase [Bacillus cereus]PFS00595.1 ADP-ribose pyrophosphatase [Bacillus cereus]